MKQRIFSLFTALCLCLTLLPTMAFAEGENDGSTETHTHCVCGETHTVIGDHTEESKITFTAWALNTSLPASSGYYYLTDDVTLAQSLHEWTPADGMVLCLNGHTITSQKDLSVITINRSYTFTLTDCKSDNAQGKVTHDSNALSTATRGVLVNGTFNMYGGKITGNKSYKGGGVDVNGSVFNLYGGSIVGNESTGNGGGVCVYRGRFTMYGGTISGNSASGNGAGVYMGNNCRFTLSGDAQITGNMKTGNSTPSNVYLSSGNTITLTEAGFTGLADITTVTAPTVSAPVQVLSGLEDYSSVTSKFTSDVNTKYHVNDSGKLVVDRCTGCVYENGVCTVCGYICPHSNVDANNKCGECASAMIAKVEHTEGDTITGYYASLNAAIEAAKAGDTITLLANVNESVACTSKNFTLDLNGKTLSSLTVSGTAIEVKDSGNGGKIETLTTSGNVKIIDLLESGHAFKDDNNNWYDSTHNKTATSVANAAVKPVPITGASIATADNTTLVYGYTDALTFTTTSTGTANGASVTYKWYVDNDKQTGETGSTFTFPTGKSVDAYTVKCEATVDGYAVTSDGITVTVTKATPTYTAPTANTLTYNGGKQALVQAGSTNGGTMQYKLGENGTWSATIPEAEDAGDYTVYWQIVGGTNYENIASVENQNIVEVTIGKKDVTITPNAVQSKKFGATDPTLTYTTDLTGDIVTKFNEQHSGSLSREQGENISTYIINLGTLSGGTNFNVMLSNTPVYFNITKADAPTLTVAEIDQVYTVVYGAADLSQIISGMPTDAGTISYTVDTENLPFQCTTSISEDGKTFSFAVPGPGTVGNSYTFPVIVSSTNYQDVTVSVILNFIDKAQKTLTDVGIDGWTYGETANTPSYTKPENEGTETRCYKAKDADDSTYTASVPTDAGDYTMKVSYETTTEIWSGTADFTIAKATPTGAPKYTAINTSGKTLADTALTLEGSTIVVPGTVEWVDADGSELASATEVKANTAYKWLFTPTDTVNYNTLSGEITLWHKSSGGSSSSNNTTITVPVSSDHATVEVKADVSKGNATVEVSDKQIEKVAADGAGNVTLDVSGLKNVESATVPSHVVEKTNKAEDTGLTVALPTGSVTLDETALDAVSKGKDVTVSVKTVSESELTTAQKTAIGEQASVAVVVDVNIVMGTVKQSSFNGGKLTISVPYTPKKGEDTGKLTVWFIRDDGTIENKGGYYDAKNKCFVFETDHLSQYILVNPNEMQTFVDVPTDAYFANAVSWAAGKGITGGVDATHFMPNNACTRAQIVTFLWRAAGSPEPKTTSSFSDVSADAYYAKAVAWAVENGITGGIGNNQFAPDLTCTRAQAAAFLFRYAAANGMEAVTLQELVGGYGDAAQVPGYALPAFNWALAQGILQGYNGNLMPNNDCTRAQIVTMLYRLLGTN